MERKPYTHVCGTTFAPPFVHFASPLCLHMCPPSQGCVRCARKLIESGGSETHFLTAKMLGMVGLDRSSRHRTLEDGFMQCLKGIIDKEASEDKVHAAAAQALANISSFSDLTGALVKRGGIDLLISLCSGHNMAAKHYCGTAFCNFLKDESCHDAIIREGALKPLMELSMDPQMANDKGLIKALSFAIYNISCGKHTVDAVMEAGVLKCLVAFSTQDSVAIRERVAAAICNLALSKYRRGKKTIALIMIEEKVLVAIKDMMDSKEEMLEMPEVTQQCVTALAIFAHDRKTHKDIVAQGCVEVLVGLGLVSNDSETKCVCASVLSSLTFGEVSRRKLIAEGGLQAIIRLSDSSDEKVSKAFVVPPPHPSN